MSGKGSPDLGPIDCHDLRVAVVAANWHQTVMDGLLAGARRALEAHKVEAPTIVRVPGSFELPVVAAALAEKGYEAVIALGVVIRGGTPHFDYVCQGVTQGLAQVSVETGVPIGFGVLTCDTMEQALDRAGGKAGNKGAEAALCALEMAGLLEAIDKDKET